MSGPSFVFPSPEAFVAGAIGRPGQRVFYLQVSQQGEVRSFKLEKQQVAALATYVEGMLADLPQPEPGTAPPAPDLVVPLDSEWTVGSIGVAYDTERDRIVVALEELVDPETDPEAADEPVATARCEITRGQAAAFAAQALRLVEAGRPPCRICGRPMDPEGHVCPRSNGHGVK